MIPKIDFFGFFFLQLFMLTTTSNYEAIVWQVEDKFVGKRNVIRIPYNPAAHLEHHEAYVFLRVMDNRVDIIWWIGPQTTQVKRLHAAFYVGSTKQMCKEHSLKGSLHITRKTFEPNVVTFHDLLSPENIEPEKIPRLYKVTGAYIIRQIPLNSVLDNAEDSYLLDDTSSVTIYDRPTCEIKTKIAKSLATYIINNENGGKYQFTYMSPSGEEENFESDFQRFRDQISSILKLHSESKTDVLPKSDVGSSKSVNKKGKAKNKKSTDPDREEFNTMKLDILVFLNIYKHLSQGVSTELQTQTDSSDPLINKRTSSTTTASTSTASTRANSKKKSKAGKGKTSLNETVNSSSLESEFTNAVTISAATDRGNNEYENIIPVYLSVKDCIPKPQPVPIDTLKSKCVYIWKDLKNKETFIYLGKKSKDLDQRYAIAAGELDIIEDPSWKLTIVLPDDPIPTAFMINIRDRLSALNELP